MKYLGIDFGTKDVGIALSDEGGSMAFPRTTLQNNPDLVPAVVSLIEKESVGALVIGLSLNNQGGENPVMKHVQAFLQKLTEIVSLPVYFEPEQFTSKEASRLQGDTKQLDASAAAIILNSFLQKQNPTSILDETHDHDHS